MGYELKVPEAKRLLSMHTDLMKVLQDYLEVPSLYKTQIRDAAKRLIAKRAMEELARIPVEELNRNKNGYHVKSLREGGYRTLADIAGASAYSLSSVKGVSMASAEAMKRTVQEQLRTTSKTTRLRLSADAKDADTTQLVMAVLRYDECRPPLLVARRLLSNYRDDILHAMEDIRPGTGRFKWLFSSARQKQGAEGAFRYLSGLQASGYTAQVEGIRQEAIRIDGLTAKDAWDAFSKDPIRFFTTIEQVCPNILGPADDVYGLPEDLAREIQEECFFPDGLLCELRRYQEWGVKYILHQGRVLLGDEMGLGKTVQAIAAMVSLRNTGATHFMVVCPVGILSNWCREIRKHSLLSVTSIYGADRMNALRSWMHTGGVAVTTYETTAHLRFEQGYTWSLLVVDEAHYVKNPKTQRTKNVKALSEHAERLLFMTGTALENSVSEMIALIKMLRPDIAQEVRGLEFLASAPQFREKVAPVYYRRKRKDVLAELPELIESQEWCTMGEEEEAQYERAVLSKKYADARRVSWNVDDLKDSSKARRLQELVEDAKEDDRKIIVFSFFLDTISKVQMLFGTQCLEPITGAVSSSRRQAIIDEFEKAPAGTVLVSQITAGGVGLNIQAASVVVICEPQFKPSTESQAISRAYRMGQSRNVLVYRLLCENTVDEKITAALEEKQRIFDAFADKSVAAEMSLDLDQKTWNNIIEEEIQRINEKQAAMRQQGAQTMTV